MDITDLLRQAEDGRLPGCAACPSSPVNAPNPAFGTSCTEHGVDWCGRQRAISMMIVSNPAGTTPTRTGRLCFVHNSVNPSDRTAQHAFALWRAAVSQADKGPDSVRYISDHYWTNAALHGTDDDNLETARQCCVPVLAAQIGDLRPAVIIASGREATASLHEMGLLSQVWSQFRSEFATRAHREISTLPSGVSVEIFCTYHTSWRVVGTHARRLHSAETESIIAAHRAGTADPSAVDTFLKRYPLHDKYGPGMRVLLTHWIGIGEAIRRAHGCV